VQVRERERGETPSREIHNFNFKKSSKFTELLVARRVRWCSPSSSSSPLNATMDSSTFYLTNLFHQGSYTSFLAAFQSLTESPSDLLQLYAARSHLALTPPATAAALEILSKLPETLDSRAVTSLAQYLSGETETAVSNLEELLAETGEQGLADGDEGRMVRSIVGTVWIFEGEERREECIEVLREGIEIGKDEEW
jgi:coatomer protein complex subunit epsilon